MINIFQPTLGDEELEAVGEVFRSNWIGKGKQVATFEEGFAQFLSVPRENVRSISCCTEGMFSILEVLGLGEGDEVVLPSISFIGAGNAIANTGAKPVFCDVDRRTLNPTVAYIREKITSRTKAVILIHYGGVPCEIEAIAAMLRERGIALIEDSACSVASRVNGRACGTFGDFGVWSFDAMKILVTGDGSMVYAKDPAMAQKIEYNSYLGLKSKSGIENTIDKKWWEFDIDCFGRRAIMNDISGAIGNVQLRKLPEFILRRREIAEFYDSQLSGIQWLETPAQLPPGVESSYYFYWLQFESEAMRNDIAFFLRDRGIYTTFRYYPLHLVKYFNDSSYLPNTEVAAHRTLCIPIHQGIEPQALDKIVREIKNFEQTLVTRKPTSAETIIVLLEDQEVSEIKSAQDLSEVVDREIGVESGTEHPTSLSALSKES